MVDFLDRPTAEEAQLHPVLWGLYSMAGQFRAAKHLWFLGDLLVKCEKREILRLCVSMPPQHGKSWMISRLFPTWFLGHHPDKSVIQISYGQDLTVESTGVGRDLLAEYGDEVFGVDTWARAKRTAWDAYVDGHKAGGGVRGVGVSGGVTGRKADLLIIDDPIKDRETAENPVLRRKIIEWIESVVQTRLAPDGILIIVATRWHHEDVIGHFEAKQEAGDVGVPWTIVNIPAVAVEGEEDPLGRQPGEPLWPEYYCKVDPDWYKKKEIDVGSYTWEALYQGRPTAREGGTFKKAWFRRYIYHPENGWKVPGEENYFPISGFKRIFATVDLAVSLDELADWTVCSIWGIRGRWLLLLHVLRKRMEGPDIAPALIDIHEGEISPSLFFLEKMGTQLALIQDAQRAGLPVRPWVPFGDKMTRAISAATYVENGTILFPTQAKWLQVFEKELCQFPAGKDDQVDTVSMAADLFSKKLRTSRGKRHAARGVLRATREVDPLDLRGGFHD